MMVVPNYFFIPLMLSTALCVDAYVTSISRSSFVARRSPTLRTHNTQNQPSTTITTTTTTLHMNLFDRFSRVAKSNLNNILQSLEDPEKIMTQALEDMQVRCEVCLLSLCYVVRSLWVGLDVVQFVRCCAVTLQNAKLCRVQLLIKNVASTYTEFLFTYSDIVPDRFS
jgi:hypothetical protein